MGEYADDLLAHLYPEAFGRRRYPRRNPEPRAEIVARFVLNKIRFVAWTDGRMQACVQRKWYTISRATGSRAFLRGYPRELEATPIPDVPEAKRRAKVWIARGRPGVGDQFPSHYRHGD